MKGIDDHETCSYSASPHAVHVFIFENLLAYTSGVPLVPLLVHIIYYFFLAQQKFSVRRQTVFATHYQK